METILFTPASLIDLLSQIDELSHLTLGVSETLDGQFQLTVGDSNYLIETNSANDIVVDEDVVEEVEDINYQAYDELSASSSQNFDVTEPIESGIIKELAKTLLVGGLVRLTGKFFSKGK